jgi:hypothetical protein
MNQQVISTNWQNYFNFKYFFHSYINSSINSSILQELLDKFIEYTRQIDRKKYNYIDNSSGMLVDDDDDIENSNYYYMEVGNSKYFTFQSIGRKVYFIQHIGDRISTRCGYIDDYPKEAIPYFLMILRLFFPSLKFTKNYYVVQIWNLDAIHNDFIQYLFLIIKNNQNPEFNFEQFSKDGGVQDRKENKSNEFSISTKKFIRENANYCCESCGERQQKPNYCKKSGEKLSKYAPKDQKLHGYIDHINEHRFGGRNNAENGQLLCHICHSKKTNMFSKTKKLFEKIQDKFETIFSKYSIKKISKKKTYC